MLASFAAVVFVFGLLSVALWWLRRFAKAEFSGRYLQVIESAPLGNNRQLSLVKVGSRCFLLAATGERVSLIGEVAAEELPAGERKGQVVSRRISQILGMNAESAAPKGVVEVP